MPRRHGGWLVRNTEVICHGDTKDGWFGIWRLIAMETRRIVGREFGCLLPQRHGGLLVRNTEVYCHGDTEVIDLMDQLLFISSVKLCAPP